jgi:Ribbon-helix-helix protein, copG family
LEHRLQLLLDEERYRRVAREAKRRGVSIAAVIREAIDDMPPSDSVRRAAIAALLAADPMEVPADPAEIRRELDAAHDRVRE